MKKQFIIFTVLTFFLTGCITPGLIKTNPVGKVYKNSIQLRNKTIPLPEGEWKVIGRGFRTQEKYFELFLLKETKRKEFHSGIIITTDTPMNDYNGYLASKYFKRTNLHHVVVKNNATGGAQDCWLINHIRMAVNPNRPARKEAYNYFESNHILIPKNTIEVSHRFTGKYHKSKFLEVNYYYNPEVEGFEPPTEANWSTSDWHPLQIIKYPKKVEYIERLKKEGVIMHEKVREGFGE